MRLKVWPDDQGGGGLAYYDSDGSGWRGQFRMAANDQSLFTMRGDAQQGGIDITVEDDGSSRLKMFGKNGKGGVDIKVTAEGTPSLAVTDKTGKLVWQLPKDSSANH